MEKEIKDKIEQFVEVIGGHIIEDDDGSITAYIHMDHIDDLTTFIKSEFKGIVLLDEGDEEPERGHNYPVELWVDN